MNVRVRLAALVPLGALILSASSLAAQEARAPAIYDTTGTAWVYASYFRIPWPRVDSLVKLQRFLPALRARGIALGCFLDTSLLIHQTGNEYNVVVSNTYRSFQSLTPGGAGAECRNRAWGEVVADSTLRAEIRKGMDWVYGDAAHYDVIYWVPYPTRP